MEESRKPLQQLQRSAKDLLCIEKGEVKKATGNSCLPLIMRIQMRRMHLSIVHIQADEQQRAWHESAINILTKPLYLLCC